MWCGSYSQHILQTMIKYKLWCKSVHVMYIQKTTWTWTFSFYFKDTLKVWDLEGSTHLLDLSRPDCSTSTAEALALRSFSISSSRMWTFFTFILWVCYIYHLCLTLLFVNQLNVQLVGHHVFISVDLEFQQDLGPVIVQHCPTWPAWHPVHTWHRCAFILS